MADPRIEALILGDERCAVAAFEMLLFEQRLQFALSLSKIAAEAERARAQHEAMKRQLEANRALVEELQRIRDLQNPVDTPREPALGS